MGIPALYFMVYCDKSQDKTALLFAEFRMKLVFCTLIYATKLGNLRNYKVTGLSKNFHIEVSLHS